jgi:hypothetical protein
LNAARSILVTAVRYLLHCEVTNYMNLCKYIIQSQFWSSFLRGVSSFGLLIEYLRDDLYNRLLRAIHWSISSTIV